MALNMALHFEDMLTSCSCSFNLLTWINLLKLLTRAFGRDYKCLDINSFSLACFDLELAWKANSYFFCSLRNILCYFLSWLAFCLKTFFLQGWALVLSLFLLSNRVGNPVVLEDRGVEHLINWTMEAQSMLF